MKICEAGIRVVHSFLLSVAAIAGAASLAIASPESPSQFSNDPAFSAPANGKGKNGGLRTISAKLVPGQKLEYVVSLSGHAIPNAKYTWWVEPENKGTVILDPKALPLFTQEPGFTLLISQPDAVVVQVLFTLPGERVVAAAARLVLGTGESGPDVQMSAFFMLPEVGDEVVVALGASSPARSLSFSTDFGDKGKPVAGQTVRHRYGAKGGYRITSSATDRRKRVSSAYIDIDVLSAPPLVNPCSPIPGTSTSFRCTNTSDYAVCMIFLRETKGDYTCEDASNPLNNADKLSGGAPVVMPSCSLSPDLPLDGWRCFTDPALTQCRRYLVGHQHLSGSTVRHCQFEDVPDRLFSVQPIILEWMLGPGSFSGTEGRVEILFDNPGPRPLSGQCNETIANNFGETCARSCLESWHSSWMEPDAPEIPVIQKLSCNATFLIGTLSAIGDTRPRAEATCLALLATAPAGSTIPFTTTVWMSIIGHYMWNDPGTSSTPTSQTYTNHFVDSPTPTDPVAVPAVISCSN